MPLDPGAAVRGALTFRARRRDAAADAAAAADASARRGAADCTTLRALASSSTASAAAATAAARAAAAARPRGGWSVLQRAARDGSRDVAVHAFARRGETAGARGAPTEQQARGLKPRTRRRRRRLRRLHPHFRATTAPPTPQRAPSTAGCTPPARAAPATRCGSCAAPR
jgi:hypothetical protein